MNEDIAYLRKKIVEAKNSLADELTKGKWIGDGAENVALNYTLVTGQCIGLAKAELIIQELEEASRQDGDKE